MAELGRLRTLFLAAIMAITASTAASMSTTPPAWAGSAAAGGRAGTVVSTSRGPALKLVARPATAAVTGYIHLESFHSLEDLGAQCLSTYLGLNDEAAVQFSCDNNNAQQWALGGEWGSTGFYQLINKNGQCLGVAGGSTAATASVVGWNCAPTHPDQYWGFYAIAGGPYYALRDLNSGYFLTVYQGQVYNNAIIDQESYQGQPWQLWATY